MIGAIAGDIIGSVYEHRNIKSKTFPLFTDRCCFTDDSILSVALADSIMTGAPYEDNLRKFYWLYPDGGYGGSFHGWARDPHAGPYNSWGNGAAMRISPVGYAYDILQTVLDKAREFTEVTHNHPEGIKGAQATAAAIFLARSGKTKAEIREFVETRFRYDLSRHVDEIRPTYRFDVSCQGTVPQAVRSFLDSDSFEDAIRTAVSLGGDSDTLACITGGIAQAFYGGVPEHIQASVFRVLDERLTEVTSEFMRRFCVGACGRVEVDSSTCRNSFPASEIACSCGHRAKLSVVRVGCYYLAYVCERCGRGGNTARMSAGFSTLEQMRRTLDGPDYSASLRHEDVCEATFRQAWNQIRARIDGDGKWRHVPSVGDVL